MTTKEGDGGTVPTVPIYIIHDAMMLLGRWGGGAVLPSGLSFLVNVNNHTLLLQKDVKSAARIPES